MVAMALVLVAATVAAWLVAGPIGPGLFCRHVLANVRTLAGSVVEHAETAFASVSALTPAVALRAAALTALGGNSVLARRIGASLGGMSRAAAAMACA